MASCPNVNSLEWRKLVNIVGETEAYRDFMVHGTIRDVTSVLMSINARTPELNAEIKDQKSYIEDSLLEHNKSLAEAGIAKFASAISDRTGIPYKIITIDEAFSILDNASLPYNSEPSFFYNGTAYFISGRFNKDMVLHEFSHPIVTAIKEDNPQLYSKLVADAYAIPGMQEYIDGAYSDQSQTHKDMEAIVRAMAQAEPESSFLKRLLYAIKQFLRKVFKNKIELKNLSRDTTLNELFQMIQTEEFNIEFVDSSNNNIVEFFREDQEFISKLQNAKSAEVEEVLINLQQLITTAEKMVEDPEVYKELKEFLEDEDSYSLFKALNKDLKDFKDLALEEEKLLKRDGVTPATLLKTVMVNNLRVLSKNIATVETLVENLEAASIEFSQDPTQAELTETQAIIKISEGIKSWVESLKSLMESNGVPSDNAVMASLQLIEVRANNIKRQVVGLYKEFAIDFLYEELADARNTMAEVYDKRIAQLEKEKKAGAKDVIEIIERRRVRVPIDKAIELVKKQKAESAQTKEGLRKILDGMGEDASLIGSVVENFINNPDPVIGGFGTWYRKHKMRADIKNQKQMNEFITKILPKLKKAGYKPSNPQAFFRRITFLDKSTREATEFVPELGEKFVGLEEYEVHTLLNPFKNYKADLDLLNQKIREARAIDDKDKLASLLMEKEAMQQFFFRKYTPEFENAYAPYNTEIGQKAKRLLDEHYEMLKEVDRILNGLELQDITEEAFQEKKEILRSIKYLSSEYDIYGKKKTGEALEIAKTIRQVKEDTQELYETAEVPGLFKKAFETFTSNLDRQDLSPETSEYEALMTAWIESNTRVELTDEYYERKEEIFNEIAALTNKEEDATDIKILELREKLNELLRVYRNSNREIDALDMSNELLREIKNIEEQLVELKSQKVSGSGLTQYEHNRLSELFALKEKLGGKLDRDDYDEFRELLSKRKEFLKSAPGSGITAEEAFEKKMKIQSLFEELEAMEQLEYSSDYILSFTNLMSDIRERGSIPELFDAWEVLRKYKDLSKSDIVELMSDEQFKLTALKDSAFKKWYNQNHFVNSKDEVVPTKAWTVTVPLQEKYYKSMVLPTGEEILRVPSNEYTERSVKEEYLTKRVVGETIDVWGNWLPDLSVVNNPYRNEEYFRLKREDPSTFQALEALSEWHLSKQEGLNVMSRLGYQIPRFRPDALEHGQEIFRRGDWKGWYDQMKSYVSVEAADDYQEGLGNAKMATTFSIIDDDLAKIPIHGVAKIDQEGVSLNVMDSIARYNVSAVYQEMLIETSPIANMIIDVVENAQPVDTSKVNRRILEKTGAMHYKTYQKIGKHGSVREMALKSFYEREYLGKYHADTMFNRSHPKTSKALNKVATLGMRLASTSFFAVNIPSSLKNRFAAVFQNNIEAIGGTDISARGYMRGKLEAKKALGEITTTIYEDRVKGRHGQIVQVFDVDGQLEKQKGALSRTLGRDIASGSFLFSPRKFLQLDGTLELLYGMLHSKQIELKDGSKVSLANALVIKDGQLQVRPDTKEDWSLESENFIKFRLLFQGKMNRLQGTYDQVDQPLMGRYLIGRMETFLRKYFVSMFMHRFAPYRIQYDTGAYEAGYYRSGIMFLYNLARAAASARVNGGTIDDFNRNTEVEVQGIKRLGVDVVQQMVLLVLFKTMMRLMFGYDPDDDDEDKRKGKLLRKGSGPLPLPGVSGKYDFNPMGFFQLHMISQMMQVHQEANTFTPWSADGLALSGSELFKSPFQAIWSPSYGRMWTTLTYMLNPNSRTSTYTRDVGPWAWQKKGSSKLWAELFKFVGLTGKTVDPAEAILKWEQGQRLRKR
jgi:hypothetical protein